MNQQGSRGLRAVTWQVGKAGLGGSEEVARWERYEGSGVSRWKV